MLLVILLVKILSEDFWGQVFLHVSVTKENGGKRCKLSRSFNFALIPGIKVTVQE